MTDKGTARTDLEGQPMRRRRASDQLLELLADREETADGPYDFGSGRATAWAKRRRLRKGTFSCVECKRRKVRCHFGAGEDVDVESSGSGQDTCVSCRRHGVQCVGQELESRSRSRSPLSLPANTDRGSGPEQRQYSRLGERISEVEALVEELMRQRMEGRERGEERSMGERREMGEEGFHPMSSINDISDSSSNTSDLARELIQLAVCLQTLDDRKETGQMTDVAEAESLRSSGTTMTPLASKCTSVHSIASADLIPSSHSPSILPLERRHAAIIVRIAARNRRLDRPGACCHRGQQVYYDDVWETRDIDYAFQQAAAVLPPRWWAVPDMVVAAGGDGDSMNNSNSDRNSNNSNNNNNNNTTTTTTNNNRLSSVQRADAVARILGQSKHFFLLVLLHLPYLTRRRAPERTGPTTASNPPETCSTVAFDTAYSTLSACSAAREVLARAAAFWTGRQAARRQETLRGQSSSSTTSYCAIDLQAFVACVALLLAHLDGHGRAGRAGVVVQHQRLADVAAVTAAIDHLATLSHADGAIRIAPGAKLLRRLLAVEAEAEADEEEEEEEEELTERQDLASTNTPDTLLAWAARRRRRPRYDVWAEEGTLGRGDGRIVDHGAQQILSVPYFGTVHIRRL
ncbi:c6 zinc finger domain containing protein [Grosmannia clavigera kw1407]|uniref:C6 zinc finger domain containing protein n=1 Tax=Grosmannia clavigera (strain kw1407 / UAMH 11150) TaxID=655863 RepID=F0X7C1_GROCL|nr:c6 zinc finger domain containing protein [Grosmannia clavigera kw1407]EFX06422.1 c6 zinc finger domain containing protein [Grosmannia clavigera kw1407]